MPPCACVRACVRVEAGVAVLPAPPLACRLHNASMRPQLPGAESRAQSLSPTQSGAGMEIRRTSLLAGSTSVRRAVCTNKRWTESSLTLTLTHTHTDTHTKLTAQWGSEEREREKLFPDLLPLVRCVRVAEAVEELPEGATGNAPAHKARCCWLNSIWPPVTAGDHCEGTVWHQG